ncbi:MAG: transcription initiation factor IIB family protein [Promethearchaeota archaeon]
MKNYRRNQNKEDQPVSRCCEDPCINLRNGNSVCINCGLIIDVQFVEQETRAYTHEEIERRKQNEPKWRDFGSRTILPKSKTDYKGNCLTSENKTMYFRLSKIQNSLISSIERNFWEAKPKMKQYAIKLNIPEHIYETAWKIYSVVAKKKLTMGRSIDGFVASSLYIAIRVHEFPKMLEEICDAFMIPRKLVIHCLSILLREVLPELNLNYKPIDVKQLIFKYGNELGLSLEVQKNALDLISYSSKKGLSLSGKDPRGFAASALYIAAKELKERKTQTEFAENAKITEVTLRSRIKDIKNKLILTS